MTVGELVAALAALPSDMPVHVRDFHGEFDDLDLVESAMDCVDLDVW